MLRFTVRYSDPDFAALERDGMRIQLHADHTYEPMPWARMLATDAPRGLGVEVRILGLDPDAAERAARERGHTVVLPTRATQHGWRECYLADPDGDIFAVGVVTPE